MLTLYHTPKSRSNSIVWLLEELGVPYHMRVVDIRRADGTGAIDPVNPHPHGKVPCLEHDGCRVFETAAIALYLTDLYPEKKIGYAVGDPHRGEYLSWLTYRPGVFEPAMMMRRLAVTHIPGAMGWAPAEEVEETLNQMLENREYLVGDRFSAADILVGGGIAYMARMKLMHGSEAVRAYTERLIARPAFKRAMES